MLTEERFKCILELLNRKQAVTVQELTQALDSSESTVRRDLAALAEQGKLNKVHGGATAITGRYDTHEDDVGYKHSQYSLEKQRIGAYGATLVKEGDLVYVDAGTSTEALVDALTEKNAVYVTNGLHIAAKLLSKGLEVYLPGGRIRQATEAIVGEQTIEGIQRYNFSIAFIGTNGITKEQGFSTPNIQEAKGKEVAIKHSRKVYILADPSKFGRISPVTFASIGGAAIITTRLQDEAYREYTEILEADK